MSEDLRPDLNRYADKYTWSWIDLPGGPALSSSSRRDELPAELLAIRSCLVHAVLAAAIAPAAVYGFEMMEWIRPVSAPVWIIPASSAAAAFMSRLVIMAVGAFRLHLRRKRHFAAAHIGVAERLLAYGFREEHISCFKITSLEDLRKFSSGSDLPEKVRAELIKTEAAARAHFQHSPKAGYYALAVIDAALHALIKHFREERRAEGKSTTWPFM